MPRIPSVGMQRQESPRRHVGVCDGGLEESSIDRYERTRDRDHRPAGSMRTLLDLAIDEAHKLVAEPFNPH